MLEKIAIDNAADDTGNDKNWGYTYRVNDPGNIVLGVNLKISGGHVSAPLYYTIHNTDTQTKNKLEVVQEGEFSERLNAGEGSVKATTSIRMANFDPSKLYTLIVAYDLKGQRTTLGTIRFAAGAGVSGVPGSGELEISMDGSNVSVSHEAVCSLELYDARGAAVIKTEGLNPSVDIAGLAPGIYIVKNGTTTFKFVKQ